MSNYSGIHRELNGFYKSLLLNSSSYSFSVDPGCLIEREMLNKTNHYDSLHVASS